MQVWKTLVLAAPLCGACAQQAILPVVVYDDAGVPSRVLTRAEEHYSTVLANAGITVEWVRPQPERTAARVDTPALTIHIMSPARGKRLRLTGYSVCLGLALSNAQTGDTAVVLYEQIRAAAGTRHWNLPLILGHVMAHETGHLLLGDQHSVTGVMKATWRERDLSEIGQGRSRFTRTEANEMRRKLSAGRLQIARNVRSQ
jgi:hypothetical protein